MAITKFIEEIGEKVLPAQRHVFPVGKQQQQEAARVVQAGSRTPCGAPATFALSECAQAIRRHLVTRLGFLVPSDFVVFFNEDDAIVILAGTVRDEQARAAMVQAAGNIQGVERVDDRMVSSSRKGKP
jgi:hypothetical protein